MSVFSNRLEKVRKQAHWTKTYTAKMLKLPLTTYANYEYGSREPDIETISSIANLFHTTSDYLMGRTDNPNTPKQDQEVSKDLNEMLGRASSYDGKPINEHDREVIRAYLEGHFDK